MKIIICGAGQVGYGIAQRLVEEDNAVTVIEQSPELSQKISETLDVKAIQGHGSHPDVLDRAGAADADMLIAVTFADEVNMVAAQIAHSIFDVPIKIARIRASSYLTPEWQDLFSRENMPIDVIISPELEVGRTVLARLENPGAAETASFANDKVKLIGVLLDEDCPVTNTPLNQLTELFPELKATVVGIRREGNFFVPDKTDQMLPDDTAYIITETDRVNRTLSAFGYDQTLSKRITIVGGGNIGLFVAKSLEENTNANIKIIENSKDRAIEIANGLKRTVVLHGSGLDQALLKEAGIDRTDTVVTITNNDESNILASVIAKQYGAKRALCLINDNRYNTLTSTLSIDAFIDPKAITISRILQHVRKGRIRRLYSVSDGQAEVIEAEALETSPLVDVPLKKAQLPKDILIGAIVKKGKVIQPTGDSVIDVGDTVILLGKQGMARIVEQFFRVSLEYF